MPSADEGISTKLLKFIKFYIICDSLTVIINQSIMTIFPDRLKQPRLYNVPNYKKMALLYFTVTTQYLFYQLYLRFFTKEQYLIS